MFKSLKSKLTIPSIGIIVLVVLGIALYSSNRASSLADDLIWERACASSRLADAHVDQLSIQNNVVAHSASNDYTLLSAIMDWNAGNNRAQNRNIIINRLNELRHTMAVDSFTVRDFEGRTIVRLHDLDFYYDIDGLANAVNALQHRQSTTSFTSTAAMPMSLITTVPIIYNGYVLGTMAPIFHFNTDSFVENLTYLFDAPISIYRGRETVNSTLVVDGRRAIGVEVSDYIADIVIDGGRTYLLDHYIDGNGTISFYKPFLGAAGNTIGMMAIHFSTAYADAATSSMVFTMMIIGVGGVLLAAGIMFVLISRNLKPLTTLAGNVKSVADGNINVNIDLTNAPKDEIGAMTKDVYALVDVVKSIVTDMEDFSKEVNDKGDIEYRIDESKYHGSFNDVMKSLNGFTDGFVNDLLELLGVLDNVNKGNFNADLKKQPGKKAILNTTVDELLANLSGVSAELNTMIESISVKGDLSSKVDTNKYAGDWSKIMIGLNDISGSVEKPLRVIELAMIEMRNGNLDLASVDQKITAAGYDPNVDNYNGTFRGILVAFDATLISVAGYINDITTNLKSIADGDLTTRVTREFVGDFAAIKESLNNISSTLHKTMSDIASASEHVLSGAGQIATSAQDLATGAQMQASSVQELHATIDVVNEQTKKNARSATSASQLSVGSAQSAQKGNDSMQEMLGAMAQIKESSSDISKVIKAIEDIAFQTNLLALNASVEAARAGEHGKGFAVVADEVRTLAGRSSGSASETNELIATSISRVESGSEIAGNTAGTLDAIVSDVGEVSTIIKSIAEASNEQAEAMSQISEGLSQIAKVTQSNSAVSEETAAASQELNSQAEMLQKLVAYFKL